MTKLTSLSVRQRQVLRKLRGKGSVNFLELCELRLGRKQYRISGKSQETLALSTLAIMERRRLIVMEGDRVLPTSDGLWALAQAEKRAEQANRFRYA